jgi:hypothetical protein
MASRTAAVRLLFNARPHRDHHGLSAGERVITGDAGNITDGAPVADR